MLELRGVKGKWKKQAIENWNLQLNKHACVQVYGEKTEVLYYMLLGYAPIHKGNVYWNEKPFFSQKEQVAWICEKDIGFPYMRVQNYFHTLCDFYKDFDEVWCLKMAQKKGIVFKYIKHCTKEEKAYITVLSAFARKTKLLISDCSFKEYKDKQEWQELFSSFLNDCTMLQISKEKEVFWWKKAEVYYHAEAIGLTKELVQEDKPQKDKQSFLSDINIKESIDERKILNDLWGGENDDHWKRPEK